jgi:hypothetical protein
MAEKETGKALTREFLAERDLRIFKMRQGGIAINEIARRFGISTKVASRAIGRQLERLNKEALHAYPEVLRMELERLDSLQAAIWPLTQHRRISLDDGTDVQVEPDMKAVQQVLSIMDRRSKLLGMDNSNISIQMDVSTDHSSPIRVSMAGDEQISNINEFTPEEEAKKLLALMAKSGVLPADEVAKMVDEENIVDAQLVESEPSPEAPPQTPKT